MRAKINPLAEEFAQLLPIEVEIPPRVTQRLGIEFGEDIDIAGTGPEIGAESRTKETQAADATLPAKPGDEFVVERERGLNHEKNLEPGGTILKEEFWMEGAGEASGRAGIS